MQNNVKVHSNRFIIYFVFVLKNTFVPFVLILVKSMSGDDNA